MKHLILQNMADKTCGDMGIDEAVTKVTETFEPESPKNETPPHTLGRGLDLFADFPPKSGKKKAKDGIKEYKINGRSNTIDVNYRKAIWRSAMWRS